MKRSLNNGLIIILVLIGLGGFVCFEVKKNPNGKPTLVQRTDQSSTPVSVRSEFASNSDFKLRKSSRVESGSLVKAIDKGQKLRLKLAGREPLDFAFRDFPLFTRDYKTSIGRTSLLDSKIRVFEGLAAGQIGEVHRASLVLVGDSLAGIITMADGSLVELRGTDRRSLLALNREIGQTELICVSDPRNGQSHTMSFDSEIVLPDWSSASSVSIDPVDEFTMLASSGIDPVTGAQTLVLNAPANPPRYEASLKVATTIVVLDKSATGVNTKNNLTKITSQYLALMANVAAIYENQLGIRLLVQEMILTPDSSDYEDVPYDDNGETLKEFASWIQRWRPESTYGQSAAIRFGAGLSGGTLGIAYLNSIHTRNGVGVLRAGFGWALPSHEMGHMFGSDHSLGGVMNAQYNNSTRTFFKDIEGQQVTAAKQIHGQSSSRLSGPSIMRNPVEMPFANDDVVWCAMGEEIRCNILSNDMKQVYRGQKNNLTLAEVGQVTPRYAGSVSLEDEFVVFKPSSDFKGTAWFSYSVQGDAGRGWLHKGDVAVVVGDLGSDFYEMDLAVGQAKTLKLPGDGVISQLRFPKQATMHESTSDSGVYIIRVNADADGSDRIQYRAGNIRQTLKINYIKYLPVAEPDHFTLSAGETLHFNPLVNDWAVGLRGSYKTEPVIAVGTSGEGKIGQDFLPDGFRLVSARSKATSIGALTVHRSPIVRNGRRRNDPNGLLSFKAKENATGSGVVEYTIEDAIGQRSNGFITISISGQIDVYLDSRSYARGWVPHSGQNDEKWTQIEFNDARWKRGRNGAGYERSSGYQSLISSMLNFRATMYDKNESLYLRYSFDVDQSAVVDKLMLRMKFDDGFIAYLNGNRVASANAPLNARWNSGATALHDDQLALEFQSFDISSHKNHLRNGKNVLSIHGLNFGTTSSDMLILSELVYSIEKDSELVMPFCDPPSERTAESIMLNGRLSKSSSKVDVYFVWGKADGGPEKDNWDRHEQIKPNIEGEYRYLVDGLPAGEVLYYRLYLNGVNGLIWSKDTQKTSTLAKGVLVARPDEFNILMDEELHLANLDEGVLANDVSITEDTNPIPLTQPSHGNLIFNTNGSFSYFPKKGFIGVDYFLYRLDDAANTHNSGALQKTIVSVGDDWSYYDKSTAPNRNWLNNSFDDSDWPRGRGLLGYGNGNEVTEISFGTNPDRKNVTAYFRQAFQIIDKALIDKVIFKLLRDDAAAIYLNGREIYRDKNLSKTARHTTMASSSIVDETAYAVFELDGSFLSEGNNVIAAEVHQASRSSSDLSFALFGQAYLISGNRVTINVNSSQKNRLNLIYNVTENQIEVSFLPKAAKSYILEISEDLINWDEIKIINGSDGKLKFINKIDFTEQTRFFRLKE
ncbi:MAG: Ig-like domain-containing protein [Verrucomicrobiota bacterium]|nr:Ig-like domain-containing protein [Verrucomicrobiota bacterium]